ncbi:MAG: cupin domain-containing protein [Leptolyngbyaceae cyanobacterium SL_1_1]|nr:cupin domain-containing protein [Leptolyngbyaceae cyanobacterium RM2_2_21]NJN02543.1 cupin domain-containing protein [Leptolyngbyaceae cyanobacterium RM1_1_2]NJO08563.1 cupin domain-containing protein [Leptolyngbyaceae cyanobacterium SL_1_1]
MKQALLSALPAAAVSHSPTIKKRVLLSSGDLPHLTNFAQAYFALGQVVEAHAHTYLCEVFFVEAGNGIIRINGADYTLQVGTCIAVEPREHEVLDTGSTELVLTYFGLAIERSRAR